ncbi:hypothetical protein BU25DRAFT_23615 [Macroventuria anomochaeta]|uniref:Uncharacterized protein n=1 Tax=Macroventuria anomochaeta TaxID=301207 RepID=A0ACB6S6S0_9PLEO|nr:uncharacterized protein BU25DRAFT_23615 [Macroventuria anomochaeta]KAF2628914.1 hypothetical protein BU25DRAFT_23615 [Macroventuria anomochaeta]
MVLTSSRGSVALPTGSASCLAADLPACHLPGAPQHSQARPPLSCWLGFVVIKKLPPACFGHVPVSLLRTKRLHSEHMDFLTTRTFQHELLYHNKPSIRLVKTLPSLSRGGHIQCNISDYTTEATYECLSYRWGDPTPQKIILMKGQ